MLFDTANRPDMVIEHDSDLIAVEFKLVENGSDIRAALGQCLVYAAECHFVIAVLYDKTPDCKIKRKAGGMLERRLLDEMWDEFNARVVVVGPERRQAAGCQAV